MATEHVPVLAVEAVAGLHCRAGGIYVDGTVGSGGHARHIFTHHPDIKLLIAIDWDGAAIDRARRSLDTFSEKVLLVQDNFACLRSILSSQHIEKVDGILLDLGVSSEQLADPVRGFSFQHTSPLDMRMSSTLPITAYDIVNSASETELTNILRTYGEERFASRIARSIVARRIKKPVADTAGLRDIVFSSIPFRRRSAAIHPATRTFQALRIAVNHELDNLRQVIAEGADLLAPGGRFCIISFHSLEDRIVKQEFLRLSRTHSLGEDVAANQVGKSTAIRVITRKPITAGPEERRRNPRARSAKLRIAEKL